MMTDDTSAPPLGLPPRVIMQAQAVAAGVDPGEYIEAEFAKARDRGFDPDAPEWRHEWDTWSDTVTEQAERDGHTSPLGHVAVRCPGCHGTGEDPSMTGGHAHARVCTVCHGSGQVWSHDGTPAPRLTGGPDGPTGLDLDTIQSVNEETHPTLADEGLPVRRRAKPAKPVPQQPKRPDPLAVRFVRQVLAMNLAPGEEVRYDRPVSRSIISKKGKEFAAAYGVKLSIRVDVIDPPDDPTVPVPPDAPKAPFMWAEMVDDDVEIER